MNHRFDWRKALCLMAVLALLCGMGVAAVANGEQQPIISIASATDITRGDWVEVNVTSTVTGDGDEHIYYRAYILVEGGSIDNEGDILEEAWAEPDAQQNVTLLLPTEALTEDCNYNVYVQAYKWENETDVPVGVASDPAEIAIAAATGDRTIVFRTNRGSSTEAANQVPFGYAVDFTVYAPGAERIQVYASNGDTWQYPDTDHARDAHYTDYDFTMQAEAFYSDGASVRSGVMYFDVTEPGDEMAPFTCWVEGEDAPEANSAFTVGFEASEPDPEAPEHETRYRLNMWDMTARSENFEEYDEPVYSAEKTVSDDDYTFVIPASWGEDDQNSLVEGHAYRIEIEAWMVGVAYRSAYAHTAFAAAGGNTTPPDEKNLSLAIGDNNDALTVRSGQDFELQICAEDAVNVRVFDGEGYHNLNEDENWEDELDWEGNIIREGWSSHPENIRIEQSRGWPISYIWWVEAQYDGYDAWYRSNAVLLNVTSGGALNAPAQVTVPENPVKRGQFIPVTVQGLDERVTHLSARVIPVGNSGDEESYAEADIELYRENEATIYIPTAGVWGGEYRVMVECEAEGFDRSCAFAWVTVTEEGLDADLILSFSKQPEDGTIKLVPHEDLYVGIYRVGGNSENRVALLINGEEDESSEGVSLTKRWSSDRNGEFTFQAVAWNWYGGEGQEPDYTSDAVTVVVEGYELDAPSDLSIDPEMLILDGEEGFTLTFNEVHTVVHTEAEDDVTQDAESYTINVDTEDGQRHIYDYDVDIERVKSGEDPFVTYDDASGSYTFRMPMNYPDGENEGQPIFEAGNVYRFVVAAFAYGWSTNDSEISALVMDEESENVGISVKGFSSVDEDGNELYETELDYDEESGFYTADANTRYRVTISGEDADDFEFFDGEGWRRPEDYEDFERNEDDGAVSFFYSTGDSGNIYLSTRGRFEQPDPVEPEEPGEDDSWRYMWIQGNILKLTVEGEPLPAGSFATYHLYAGDAEEPLDPDENDVYHITRGTPLVVRFDENENEQDGQHYGVYLIDASGEWRDYHHWDDEDRSVIYPTVDVEAGEYQVRVGAAAPGYDSYAETPSLEVSDAERGQVFLSMDMADTDTCQNNTFRVYAPGAESIGLFMQENDNQRLCDNIDGESAVFNEVNSGNSGVYHVYAEAYYDEGDPISSAVLTWTVNAPGGPLANAFIDAPAILAPETDLTFTVGGVENAQNWNVRVYDAEYGNEVWGEGYDHCPDEINVPWLTEDDDEYGNTEERLSNGRTYVIGVYVSAYGFDASYQELCFTVTDQEDQNIAIAILDAQGDEVEPTQGDDGQERLLLRSGDSYKVRASGTGQADYVQLLDDNHWQEMSLDNGDDGWTAVYPQGEESFWNKSSGTYNLLVRVQNYQDSTESYAGLQVTVVSEGRLGKPIVRIEEADRAVARGDALRVHVDGVENGEFYHLRIYDANGNELYFTEDVRLGAYNYLPTGDLEPGEQPYRAEVCVGREGWDGNSASAEFTVTEPEYTGDGVQLTASEPADDEGVVHLVPNQEVTLTVYAPNCQHVELWRDGADEPEAWWDGSSLVYSWGGDRNEECTFRAKAWNNWWDGCEEEADRVSDPITVSLYGAPLDDAPDINVAPVLYPWDDPENGSVEISFNQVEDAQWYRVFVQDVTDDNREVWNDGYIAADAPEANENVRYDGDNGVITYVFPLWQDDNPVFVPGERYRFQVSACAYGRETTDGEAEALMLNGAAENVSMTVADAEANQDATVSANSQYRVTIACEGATIFEFYDGDRWNEVHHRDNLSEEENAEVEDEDGTVVFNWGCGDSCATVLTCRVMSEGDEDWTQGPAITLTVEGEELPAGSFATYHLYAGDAEEPLEPENDVYHITRGTPLVVRFDENEDEQNGQQYGVYLIDASGEWRDYHHWDDEDRSVIYPTVDVEAGEYQVRVGAAAPGYDTYAETPSLEVSDAERGQVFLSMDMADTDTCQDNTFRVYAPGAESIGLFMQENDNQRLCDNIDGESAVFNEVNSGNSGVYHVYAEAYYDEGDPISSAVLTWTVNAPGGPLANAFIDAPAILAPETDLTFTVGGVENAQNWNVRVYDAEYGNEVWGEGYDHCPDEINVPWLTEDDDEYGNTEERLSNGRTYVIGVYVSAYGFDASYQELCFTVTDQEDQNIAIAILDAQGDEVEPTQGDDGQERLLLRSGDSYKVRASGTGQADYVQLLDDNHWQEMSLDNGDDGWTAVYPQGEESFWNKSSGTYNLLVRVQNYQDSTESYAGLQVTVVSEGRLGKPIVRIEEADRAVARGDALRVHVDGVENGEFYHLRIYDANGNELYFTEDVRLGAYNYLPTGDLEPGEQPYRAEVCVGREGWDGNSASAEFTVTEPEYTGDGVQLTASEPADDEGVVHLVPNQEVTLTVYAPNCQHVELWRDGADEPEAWWDGSSLVYSWGGDRNEECTFRAKAWNNWWDGCEEEADRVSDPITVSLYGAPLDDAPDINVAPVLYPWDDPENGSVEISFNQVEDAQWYRVFVQDVTDDNREVWNDGYIAADAPEANENVRYDGDNGVITYVFPLWQDDNPVFVPGERYRFQVSACAYGRETTDGEAEALMLNGAAENVSMTVADAEANQDATVSANSQYRVTIACEGATIFEFYDGDRWNEVHHRDNLSEEENAEVEDEDGTVVFNWGCGDSCATVLTCRVMSEGDEDWTQGPAITLTVEGEELPAGSFATYHLYAGDAEDPLEPDENDVYHITRGTPLVVRFDENENEQNGQQYGVYLIDASGEWRDYHHWDDEDRSVIYPTVDVEAGEYQVRVGAAAPGFDSYAETPSLEVSDAERGQVFLSMDMTDTDTCQNNTFRVYAPGAESIGLFMRENNNEKICDFEGESGVYDCNRGNSGVYHVYAEADYGYNEDIGENETYRSEVLTWTVNAPNGALAMQSIDAPVFLGSGDDLTFTVGEINNAENWSIRVCDAEYGDEVWGEGYDHCPGEINVPWLTEDENGDPVARFEDGHTYAIAVYASAYGYDASYREVCFMVAEQSDAIQIEMLDGETGDQVDPQNGILTGRSYKARVSGSEWVDHVDFYDGSEWYWSIFCNDENESEWSFDAPTGEDQFWNKQGGSYNLLVKAFDDQGEVIGYAGLPVKVQSYGTLNKPNVFFWEGEGEQQHDVPTTTVTRGDALRVHVDPVYREEDVELANEHYEVRIYGSHQDFADEYWHQTYFEANGTGDFELPTANLPATWQDENDPEAEPVPMAYRVEVNAGADGWESSWNYAEFTVVEPEQEEREPILTVMRENDLWVNEDTAVSVYAPGATSVRVDFEGDGDLQSSNSDGDYWTGTMYGRTAGWMTLTATAWYPAEDGGDQEDEVRVEKRVEVYSLGRLGAPEVLLDSPTLPEGTDALTFSFGYSSHDRLDECYLDWEGFDINERYRWSVDVRMPDAEDSEVIFSNDEGVPRGENETYGPISIGAEEGFQWVEGAVYYINVRVSGSRCEDSNEIATILCANEGDGAVTLEAYADSGRALSELVRNENVQLHVTVNAPEDVEIQSVEMFEDRSWDTIYDVEDYRDFTFDRCFPAGAGALIVRAWWEDEPHISNAVPIRVQSLGKLEAPEVTVQSEYATVARGEFLDVNIGEVPNAEWNGYNLTVDRWEDNNWSQLYDMSDDGLPCGPYQLPTGSLEPGRYRVLVRAFGVGWDDSDNGWAEFTVAEPGRPDEDGFIISVSNDQPRTCENWKVSALYVGEDEEVNNIRLERADGREPNDGRQYAGNDSAWALWSDTREGEVLVYAVAGHETWNMEMEYQYTELFRSAPVTVTVEAGDDLTPPVIEELAEVLDIDDPNTEALTMRVWVDDAKDEEERYILDNFGLNIFQAGGGCVYSQGWPAGEEDRDEEGYVTVSVPLDQIGGLTDLEEGQSAAYHVQVYTCAWNRNDAEAESPFLAVRGLQQDVRVELAEGENPNDLWTSSDFRLAVSAPGAIRVCVVDDFNSRYDLNNGETEVNWRMGSGTHLVWAEAEYPNEDYDPETNPDACHSVQGMPLRLNIQTMGFLDVPAVTVGDSVQRGEFMTVTVGEVYLDEQQEQLAESCELVVSRANEDGSEGEFMFSMPGAAWGENLVPTATLRTDESYVIKATAHNERYDDNWSAPVLFTVEESDESVLTVSNDHPQTCETWTASAYIPGGGWDIGLWAEDENGFRYDSFEHHSGEDGIQASFSVDNAVTLRLYASAYVNDEEVTAGPVPVTVGANNGDLSIALAEAPTGVRLANTSEDGQWSNELEPFEVKVDVSQTASDEFTVFVGYNDGRKVYNSDPISVDDADEDGIVTVPVHVNTYDREEYSGFTMNAGELMQVEVYTCAPGYNAGGHSLPVRILPEDADEDFTVELADGEDPDDLWTSVDFRLAVNAPAEARWVCVVDDSTNQMNLNDGETEIDWRMGSGTHLVWAEAEYPDEDYDPETNPDAWHSVQSMPLRLNIQSRGVLDVPTVETGDSVQRGQFLNVNIGEVTVGEDDEPVDGYDLQVWQVCQYEDGERNDEYKFSLQAVAGDNTVPTAALDPGDYYVKATAQKAGWDDNWSEQTNASSFTVTEPQDGLVLTVSNDTPDTGEMWWVSAVYKGSSCGIRIWAVDENENDEPYQDYTWRAEAFEGGESAQVAWLMNHSAVLTIHAHVDTGEGDGVETTATVMVSPSTNSTLEIDLDGTPDILSLAENGPEALEIAVSPSEDVESFTLEICEVNNFQNVAFRGDYRVEDFPAEDYPDGIRVYAPASGFQAETLYEIHLYTARAGWNDCYRTARVLATAMTPIRSEDVDLLVLTVSSDDIIAGDSCTANAWYLGDIGNDRCVEVNVSGEIESLDDYGNGAEFMGREWTAWSTGEYTVTARVRGILEQIDGPTVSTIVNVTARLLDEPLFTNRPAVRKGETISVRLEQPDANAESYAAELIGPMGNTVASFNVDQYGNITAGTSNLTPGVYSIVLRSSAEGFISGESRGIVRVVDPEATLTLPRALKQIGDEAFAGIQAEIIVVPDGATSIGSQAFANCENLGIVEIPGTVTSIAPDAFSGCTNFMIVCPEGSAAESFAEAQEIPCDTPAGE